MPSKGDYARMAFDFVDEFERAKSTNRVMSLLSSALGNFGFTSFLITGVPEPPLRLEPYVLVNGWSEDWMAHYTKANYYLDDPVAAWCRRTTNPFEWAEAKFNPLRSPRAAEVMQTAADFGMKRGFLVPILQSSGFQSCVTIASALSSRRTRSARSIL